MVPSSATNSTIPWETSTAFSSRTWSILWSGKCPKIWGGKCPGGKCTRTFHPIASHNLGKLVQLCRYIPNIKEQQIHSFIYFQNKSFRLAEESSKCQMQRGHPTPFVPNLTVAGSLNSSQWNCIHPKMHNLPVWWAKHNFLTISLYVINYFRTQNPEKSSGSYVLNPNFIRITNPKDE